MHPSVRMEIRRNIHSPWTSFSDLGTFFIGIYCTFDAMVMSSLELSQEVRATTFEDSVMTGVEYP